MTALVGDALKSADGCDVDCENVYADDNTPTTSWPHTRSTGYEIAGRILFRYNRIILEPIILHSFDLTYALHVMLHALAIVYE